MCRYGVHFNTSDRNTLVQDFLFEGCPKSWKLDLFNTLKENTSLLFFKQKYWLNDVLLRDGWEMYKTTPLVRNTNIYVPGTTSNIQSRVCLRAQRGVWPSSNCQPGRVPCGHFVASLPNRAEDTKLIADIATRYKGWRKNKNLSVFNIYFPSEGILTSIHPRFSCFWQSVRWKEEEEEECDKREFLRVIKMKWIDSGEFYKGSPCFFILSALPLYFQEHWDSIQEHEWRRFFPVVQWLLPCTLPRLPPAHLTLESVERCTLWWVFP